MDNFDWQQAIFDLMANRTIRLSVYGDMGFVEARLDVYHIAGGKVANFYEVDGMPSFGDAMAALMVQVDCLTGKPKV